jgi:hypothetical protein
VTSGRRDKQIQVYDPAIIRKQAIVQKSASQADKNVSNKKVSQDVPAGQGAGSADGGRSNSADQRQQQGVRGAAQQQQGAGQPRHREDDGNSALARTGYQQQQYQQGQ